MNEKLAELNRKIIFWNYPPKKKERIILVVNLFINTKQKRFTKEKKNKKDGTCRRSQA